MSAMIKLDRILGFLAARVKEGNEAVDAFTAKYPNFDNAPNVDILRVVNSAQRVAVIKQLMEDLKYIYQPPTTPLIEPRWHEVTILGLPGYEFGIVSDKDGVLTITSRRRNEKWPNGIKPTSGHNIIQEGYGQWTVMVTPEALVNPPTSDSTEG